MRIAIIVSACLGLFGAGSGTAEEAHAETRPSGGVAIEQFSGRIELADIDRVAIKHFTGRIEIAVKAGDIVVELADNSNSYPVDIEQKGDAVTIAGEKRSKKFDIYNAINWPLYKEAAFAHYVDAHPKLQLSVPQGTAIELDYVYAIADIGDLNGPFHLKSKYIEAEIGEVQSADIALHGGGHVALASVDGHLRAKVGGAGDIEAVSAGSAEILVGGSGDVAIGDIGGDATLKVSGSGDIETANIVGRVSAFIAGSGDIDAGAIAGGAEFSIAGSGDIVARSLNGPMLARIAGNGDITVEDGRAEDLKVGITGSGDFRFGGVSTNLDATINGSGSIEIAENEGALRTSGSGAVKIGNHSINNDE